MAMTSNHLLRATSLAAFMLAGSCAAPSNEYNSPMIFADGTANHPITVEPSYRSVKVAYVEGTALSPEDSQQLSDFVDDYLSRGNGAVSISAPRGPDSRSAIEFFAERLAAMGVPRSRILVGTHDVANTE